MVFQSPNMLYRQILALIMITSSLIGCVGNPRELDSLPTPTFAKPIISAATSPMPNPTFPETSKASLSTGYEFPDFIDPAKRYLFYLHGKIIEDQGVPAISPDYGEYEYEAILEKLSGYGFIVLSEQRSKNTAGAEYAIKIQEQVTALLAAGVPAKNITIVGASKGAGIAVFVSHYLQNDEVNYVILAICHPDVVKGFKQDQIYLTGNVLSIYDSSDEYAGSCQELFAYSEGKGISSHDEIVLNIGTGHGILYKPLDQWINPAVDWANINIH